MIARELAGRGAWLVALALGSSGAAAQSPATDPLTSLNQAFRTAYREARAARIAAADPVIVVQFDDLHLVRGVKVATATFTPAIYHEYKAIAHVPLALYVMLAPQTGKSIEPVSLERLALYRNLAQEAGRSLSRRAGWSAAQRAAHERIIVQSLAFIDRIATEKTITAPQLAAYARAMRPLVLASADAAARAQLDGLHALAGTWRRELGAEVWSRLQVVVLGPRQPRAGNLQYAYFERVLGRAAAGRRLWYAEGVFDKEGGLDLLGAIVLDRGASLAFFADPTRLERDLLADAAAAHLNRIVPVRR